MFGEIKPSTVPDIHCCRVCLKTVTGSGSLLCENSYLLKLFEFCTDITILPQENARSVCAKCSNRIKSHAKFKKKCLQANEFWKSLETRNLNGYPKQFSDPREVKNEILDDDAKYVNSLEISTDFSYEEDCMNNLKYELEDDNHQLVKSVKNESQKKHNVKEQSIPKFKKFKKPKSTTKIDTQKAFNCCGLCDYSSSNNDENREHLNMHWSNANDSCSLCNFTSQDSASLLTHRYMHYLSSNVKYYVCHICEKKCASTLSLEFHYRSIHLLKPGGYCSQCRKTFTVFKTWKKHCRLHTSDRFICDHCGRKFLYRNEIEAHLIDHGDKRNFICDACGKGFKRKYGLKTHMESVHSSAAIKCTHCDKVFKSRITYKDHIRAVKADKRFICVHCGKSYHQECALRAHVFWHTGARPHVCDVCGAKYKSKGQLKVHSRNHTGYLPFKCSHCDKCFASSQPLKRHQSVHTGKRAHRCGQCERTFHERKALAEHRALSHNDKVNVQTQVSLCGGK